MYPFWALLPPVKNRDFTVEYLQIFHFDVKKKWFQHIRFRRTFSAILLLLRSLGRDGRFFLRDLLDKVPRAPLVNDKPLFLPNNQDEITKRIAYSYKPEKVTDAKMTHFSEGAEKKSDKECIKPQLTKPPGFVKIKRAAESASQL